MSEPVFCPDCGDIHAFTAADRKKERIVRKRKTIVKRTTQ